MRGQNWVGASDAGDVSVTLNDSRCWRHFHCFRRAYVAPRILSRTLQQANIGFYQWSCSGFLETIGIVLWTLATDSFIYIYIYIYYKYYKYSRRGVSTPPRGKSLDIPENPESKRMWQNIKCSNVSKISKEFNSNSNRFKRSLIIGMATSEWESSMDQSEGKDRPKECATSAQRPPPETLSSSLPERNKRGFRMSSLRICQCATTANNLRSPNISLFSTSRVDPNSICKIISNMKWLDIKYHFH